MRKNLKPLVLSFFLATIPTALVWLPFLLRLESLWTIPLARDGMATIVANYDGPLYIAISKTLYNIEALKWNYQFPLPIEYYAAHFPLFPLLIRLFSYLIGSPYAMLATTIVSATIAIYFFHKLISMYIKSSDVLWMTFVFALFPARWLIVRSVGSPEPLFLASAIASIYYFKNKKFLSAGIWGAIAQLTKSPGILLFVAYGAAIFFPSFKKAALTSLGKIVSHLKLKTHYPIILIPIALIAVFYLYSVQLGDFFAYFNSGDNIHLFFPPFQVFNYASPWVGTFWLEEIIYLYLFGILAFIRLIKAKDNVVAWFFGIFFASILFVSHRDVSRYALPLVPFIFVAFSDVMVKKEFKIAFAVLIIPIYLFSLAYITQNVMPISDWTPFL